MMGFRFGTARNCIHGRTPEVVIDYMKQKCNVDGVDMVTFPGADGVLSYEQNSTDRSYLKSSFYIYRKAWQIIALVGHYDCSGNPGDREHHNKHMRRAMQEVSSWDLNTQVIGLYVNEKREIGVVK